MAIKGSDISATYQDWVHVNKAGAGLTDHAGAEAALYLDDGAGGVDQILGRTAVRHWLDPHPDAAAFAETWEFSTKGTMTQGQLETAGWTFTNCTGVVSNGMLWITASSAAISHASIVVSLAGDFDLLVGVAPPYSFGDFTTTSGIIGGFGIADTANDVSHQVCMKNLTANSSRIVRYNDTFSTLSGGTSAEGAFNSAHGFVARINRISGTIDLSGGGGWPHTWLKNASGEFGQEGYYYSSTVADADTITRIFLCQTTGGGTTSGSKTGFYFLRRFK